jgi:hypothetical protein
MEVVKPMATPPFAVNQTILVAVQAIQRKLPLLPHFHHHLSITKALSLQVMAGTTD